MSLEFKKVRLMRIGRRSNRRCNLIVVGTNFCVVALVLFGYARMPDKISFFDVSGFCTIPTQLVLHVISR